VLDLYTFQYLEVVPEPLRIFARTSAKTLSTIPQQPNIPPFFAGTMLAQRKNMIDRGAAK
jgi:hypothetical protein